MKRKMRKVHAGEILKMELIEGRNFTIAQVAEMLETPEPIMLKIMNGEAEITPDIAQKIEQVFGGSADFWLRMQRGYDLNYL
ncbi:HigA family addiction module antitoxin (plasmid) [Flavobacterium sp. TMP13]|uniref:HigA family addiction module antitoxin n=1 Tax=Flavobacterium sp. TMP13 TaxID=3425950 RepID=UPI003D76DB05